MLDKRLLCSVLRPAEIIKDPKTGKDKTEKATGSNIKAEDKEKKKKYICDVLQGHPVVWQVRPSIQSLNVQTFAAEKRTSDLRVYAFSLLIHQES